ncbi:hypothetical protein EMIHUDRAFT_233952 [Emiliania huxleyi CCMP1516]|uniref:Uncharacterized protein n=2 Tax=Emiliania huxleyi TaxID=2903 RepID=A0A0D3K119_EMIH1|nr:hypothetical protein EMIHUDRAFT_233952 [Emiliania huxleyi CCMP1516]EOD29454.1 hypothetical protein EMIHUDRAFT_233952 [Emiliania huxleyi CCMP1516]|eukprot:XP_005781883.1 hypothetical protein EMIHUDRAFT_233952 [Emiliania huxleyi CCMP1516]
MRCLHYASIIAWFGTAILFGVFFNKPPPELPPPPDTCSRRGFLWRKCSDGCVRQGSVCVPDRRLYAGLRMPMGVTEVSRRPSPARAHDLMKKRSVPNCLAAADIFEAAARAAHADAVAAAELKLMAGNALNCAMRIRGSGNILLLDGTLDTPANKKRRALQEMESAFEAAPRTRRNGYYTCLLRYQHEDFAGAAAACDAALRSGACDGPTTPDYCDRLTEETRRLLALASRAAAQ